MQVRLQPSTPADRLWLWNLHAATMRPLVEQVWGWDDDVQQRFFREYIDRGSISLIVADGTLVGSIQLHKEVDHLFLSQIEIAPEHQGHGYGSAVIRELQTTTTQPISLQVLKVNEAAARLYRRLGFAGTGETETHLTMIWTPAGMATPVPPARKCS